MPNQRVCPETNGTYVGAQCTECGGIHDQRAKLVSLLDDLIDMADKRGQFKVQQDEGPWAGLMQSEIDEVNTDILALRTVIENILPPGV